MGTDGMDACGAAGWWAAGVGCSAMAWGLAATLLSWKRYLLTPAGTQFVDVLKVRRAAVIGHWGRGCSAAAHTLQAWPLTRPFCPTPPLLSLLCAGPGHPARHQG